MTNPNPTSGNTPGLPDILSIAQTKARLDEFCKWFDLTPPKLKTRKGEVILTPEIMEWIKTSGASIDWILCGDAKCIASAYRRNAQAEKDMQPVFRKYDPVERQMLLETLRAIAADKIGIEGGVKVLNQAMDERRAARINQSSNRVY